MTTWRVFWYDNEGQKRILISGMAYYAAVRYWQQVNKLYSFCDYEKEEKRYD